MRQSIADEPFPCSAEGGQLNISTSIGGAIISPEEHSVESVLERADKCLYEAKEVGRNSTVFEGVGKIDPDRYKREPRGEVE